MDWLVTRPPKLMEKLIGFSSPVIKEISAPALGSNFHVGRSLGVSAAIETRVTDNRVEDQAGLKLIAIRDSSRDSPPAIIHRRGLRHQRVDIDELKILRKEIHVDVHHVPRR